MKRFLKDAAVVLLGGAALGACLYLLYADLQSSRRGAAGEPVGVISYKRRQAQRRPGDRVVWNPIDQDEPVFNLDALRTVAGSEAIIRLDDGTEIALEENSLVVLDFSGDTRRIDFLEGSIVARRLEAAGSGAAAPALEIASGDARIDVGSGAVDLRKSDASGLSIGVAGGTAVVRVAGTERALGPSETATVRGGSATVERSASLTAPASGAFILVAVEAPRVEFRWESAGLPGPFTVEASRTQDFKQYEAVEADGSSAVLPLRAGTWWCRLKDGVGAYGRTIRIAVLEDRRAEPLSPAEEARFLYRTAPPDLLLSWSAVPEAAAYEYQVSVEAGFGAVLREGRTKNLSAAVQGLGDGTYYWRVRPWYGYGGIGYGAASSVRSFAVALGEQAPEPQLLRPRDGETLGAGATSPTAFTWSAMPEALSYRVVLEGSDGAQVLSRELKETALVLDEPLAPGTYLWSVDYGTVDGSRSAASRKHRFVVPEGRAMEARSPLDGAELEAPGSAGLSFTWTGRSEGTLRISRSRDLSAPVAEVRGEYSAAATLPGPGTYFWAVAAPEGAGTEVRVLHILEPLEQPRPTAPGRDEELALLGGTALSFSWTPVPGATGYRFSLRRAGIQEALAETLVRQNGAEVPLASLLPGSYAWTIRAEQQRENGSTRVGPQALASFSVKTVRNPPAPRLRSPRDGQSIDGISAFRSGVRLSWDPSEEGSSYRVEVAADEGFSDLRYADRGTTPARILPDLGPGDFWWRVGGEAGDGVPLPFSVGRFTVAPIPPLGAPELRSPRNGEVLDMSRASGLSFSWTRVAGATAYLLTLTERRTGRKVFDRTVQGTEFRYSALETLDVGEYAWTLRPIAVGPSGKLERSGPDRGAAFRLTLPAPTGSPTLLTPKELYVPGQ